ncbi:MAG TPA: MBL fold metallo-hydrolase, partial [Thermoanaerobaculia bacterium]|nr:MBL fold metallo-hydrolase [Thermoanaerobaculia bacterium]
MPDQQPSVDAANVFQVHFLDMGSKKYGDCIVCLIGDKRILIDGGHLGDQRRGHPDYPSIPEQLAEILGQPAPWRFDLLVVTHAHVDHIGCLPNLVSTGQIVADWVLAADEELGWGDVEGVDAPAFEDAPEPVRQAFALLREERPAFASREEMEAFASDAARMRPTYAAMLDALDRGGAKVVRFGRDDPADLVAALRPETGLEILGPTPEHLLACARQIAALGRDAADVIVERSRRADHPLDLVEAYEALLMGSLYRDSGEFELGNAINDQSLVLAFGRGGRKVLLTGDMQLADPLVDGLEESMAELRRHIARNGPYSLVKLPHHGARNGVDAELLAETGAPLFVISGGQGSAKHPHPSTLEVLETAQGIAWYRTDRNGWISVDLATAEIEAEWVRGEPNDRGRNPEARDFLDEPGPALPPPAEPPAPPSPEFTRSVVRTPDGEIVEVLARIPHRRTKVVITIEVEPSEEPSGEIAAAGRRESPAAGAGRPAADRVTPRPAGGQGAALRLGGGRELPPLLFATDPDALANNIGREEARAVCKALEDSGQTVVFDGFRKMSS